MFRLMRDQWIVTKGIREIVIMAERDGFLMPSKREGMIGAILEFARDSGIAIKGVRAHEQVMITAMAFFGIAAGPQALSDGARWAAEYANRHGERAVLASCMETATALFEAAKRSG
jgi:hypothetical protein